MQDPRSSCSRNYLGAEKSCSKIHLAFYDLEDRNALLKWRVELVTTPSNPQPKPPSHHRPFPMPPLPRPPSPKPPTPPPPFPKPSSSKEGSMVTLTLLGRTSCAAKGE